MKLVINWDDPLIAADDIMAIRTDDLDDFYVTACDMDKANLFFVLLATFHHCMEQHRREQAAHISFLMAYYLFTALTPPASGELARHYIRQAICLHERRLYREWAAYIERGN